MGGKIIYKECFMKNTIRILKTMRSIAIIAIVAIIGFSMVSCDGDDKKPETLKAPTGLATVAKGSSYITVEWDPVPGAQRYTVEASRGTATSFTRLVDITETQTIHGSLTPNTEVRYRVKATALSSLGERIESPFSEVLTVTTDAAVSGPIPPRPTDPPGNIVITTSNSSATPPEPLGITVNWGAVTGTDIRYILVYNTTGTGGISQWTVVPRNPPTTLSGSLDTGITAGTRYYFKIIAENRGGTGPWSSVVSIIAGNPGSAQ